MKKIIQLEKNDREVLFSRTSEKKGLNLTIVEKDFWVCFMLDHLFHDCKYKDAFVFKGGTSLSKSYHVIERFSEDIDLILDWRKITIGTDPWEERSKTKQDKYNKMINEYANNTKIVELLNRIKDVDVIIAPIADNKMFNIMHQFGDGDITTIQAIHSLATSGLGKQFVLKTTKAISHLTQVERLFLSSSERKAISILMEDRGREIDTKLKLSKREFRGKGQYIDELFK